MTIPKIWTKLNPKLFLIPNPILLSIPNVFRYRIRYQFLLYQFWNHPKKGKVSKQRSFETETSHSVSIININRVMGVIAIIFIRSVMTSIIITFVIVNLIIPPILKCIPKTRWLGKATQCVKPSNCVLNKQTNIDEHLNKQTNIWINIQSWTNFWISAQKFPLFNSIAMHSMWKCLLFKKMSPTARCKIA